MKDTARRPGEGRARARAHLPMAVRWLLVVAIALVLAPGVTYLGFVLTGEQPNGWSLAWFLFDVGREHNLPTWYASLLWASLAGLGLLGALLTARRTGWLLMSAVAFVASIDEYSELHERLDFLGNRWAAALGWELWFTWVIPAIPVAVLVAVIMLPLLRSLPRGQRRLLLTGGAVYLGGAIVVETLSGWVLASFDGQVTWHYVLVTLIEEMLELIGLALAVGAVAGLYRWRRTGSELQVGFRGWAAAAEAAPLSSSRHRAESPQG